MSKTIVSKFGGASVKDAESIKNLRNILFNRLRNHTIIVVSAMGKTTNALEEILRMKMKNIDFSLNIHILKSNHIEVCKGLFEEENKVFPWVENYFQQLTKLLGKPLSKANYDEFYDQVVSFGELIASRIVQEYLCASGLFCIWQDAREIIATNNDFRFAKIDWGKTEKQCKKILSPALERFPVITQGFIGAAPNGLTTTLGREGSDFSAAIFAYCLRAVSLTIWKDVDGVLNADPKRFRETVKFEELDYSEAAELSYYGASVIHPKTIKPLANLSIPLFVKSFLYPENAGTKIHHVSHPNTIPCIVVKDNQILVSFKVMDFTFIDESHIHHVYSLLEKLKLRVNLLQISAISISIVTDFEPFKLEQLIHSLPKNLFEVKYNDRLQLFTVKNHKDSLIRELIEGKQILLEQVTRTTFQFVVKNSTQ